MCYKTVTVRRADPLDLSPLSRTVQQMTGLPKGFGSGRFHAYGGGAATLWEYGQIREFRPFKRLAGVGFPRFLHA